MELDTELYKEIVDNGPLIIVGKFNFDGLLLEYNRSFKNYFESFISEGTSWGDLFEGELRLPFDLSSKAEPEQSPSDIILTKKNDTVSFQIYSRSQSLIFVGKLVEVEDFQLVSNISSLTNEMSELVGLLRKEKRKLNTLNAELTEYKNELEEKVASRTQEIVEKNRELENEIVARRKAELAAKSASLAKTEFLTTMTHELRTPLSIILGNAQIIDSKDYDDTKDNTDSICKSGRELLGMIEIILEIATVEPSKEDATTCYLEAVIETAVSVFRDTLSDPKLKFETHQADNLPELVLADSQALHKVITQLLDNAEKFTPEGTITLNVDLADNNKVRLEVCDTGLGIPEDQLNSIFEPFYQINRRTNEIGGAGLGLTLCRKLVEKMGSSITVESEPGQGSTFWFELSTPH